MLLTAKKLKTFQELSKRKRSNTNTVKEPALHAINLSQFVEMENVSTYLFSLHTAQCALHVHTGIDACNFIQADIPQAVSKCTAITC